MENRKDPHGIWGRKATLSLWTMTIVVQSSKAKVDLVTPTPTLPTFPDLIVSYQKVRLERT